MKYAKSAKGRCGYVAVRAQQVKRAAQQVRTALSACGWFPSFFITQFAFSVRTYTACVLLSIFNNAITMQKMIDLMRETTLALVSAHTQWGPRESMKIEYIGHLMHPF